MARNRFNNKHYNFETNEELLFKTWYKNFKPVIHILLNFNFFVLWIDWETTCEKALRPGHAGSVQHGYRSYSQKETFFVR